MTQPSHLYHLICDYGIGDPAFAEVIQRFHELDPTAHFNPISVPAFSTISTGFWIAQLALYRPAKHTIIFSNTAPRHDDHTERKHNAGEQFVIATLTTGAITGVVNAGYALSFIKPHIKTLHQVQTPHAGSQFRSRDFFPKDFYLTLTHQLNRGSEISLHDIPEIPSHRIAAIDGYGNIKTTITRSQVTYQAGQQLQVILNNVTNTATFTDGTFDIPAGQIALAPGSSGDPKDPFLEIFLRRGHQSDPSAQDVYQNPPVETLIEINP